MDSNPAQPCILLVDDNADNLALMRLYLEGGSYRIATAANGREAVERYAAGPCDLVFMDLEMPVMDGYEATRAIRRLETERGAPPIPILALTAHTLDEHRLRCQEAGCTDFLVKPVRKAGVMAALARFLGRKELEEKRPEAWEPAPDIDRLRPLLPLFFDTAGQTLKTARQALETGDLATVRAQGHRLKGSARTYGFRELGLAAETMEKAGEEGNAVGAATALDWATTLLAKARFDCA